MKILFDQGTRAPLRGALTAHQVSTAHEMGWSELDNGRLLAAAEETFDVLVTTDRNLRHQQSMTGRRLAVLVLPTTSWRISAGCTAPRPLTLSVALRRTRRVISHLHAWV